MRRLAQAFIFLSFFPYPALAELGAHTGLSSYELVSISLDILSFAAVVRTRSFRVLFWIVLTMVISTVPLVLVAGADASRVAESAIFGAVLSLSILPAAGAVFAKFDIDLLLLPVSLAMFVHAAAGLWQLKSFHEGLFPFSSLLVNNSFYSFSDISDTYATYIARPFGLFPEPSAMAASLGPWVIFLVWRVTSSASRSHRRLALLAAVAGGSLVVLSASVYVAVFFAALICLAVRQLSARGFRVNAREVLIAVAIVAVGIGFFKYSAHRVNLTENTSLQDRMNSIAYGARVPLAGVRELFVGAGPGASVSLSSTDSTTQIYSVVVTAFAQGGLLALGLMIVVARKMIQGLPRFGRYILFGSWAAGVMFATGYLALGPIWLFMAMTLDAREFWNEPSPRELDAATQGARRPEREGSLAG